MKIIESEQKMIAQAEMVYLLFAKQLIHYQDPISSWRTQYKLDLWSLKLRVLVEGGDEQ